MRRIKSLNLGVSFNPLGIVLNLANDVVVRMKRQCLKISVGQRVHKVSVSSYNVVGACKVCIKPNDGGREEQKLLSLRYVLNPHKRKKTTM